jgi:hypothetical protein
VASASTARDLDSTGQSQLVRGRCEAHVTRAASKAHSALSGRNLPTASSRERHWNQLDPPCGRLGDATEDFEKRAFAGPVATDDAQNLASPDLEVHILKRPEFFEFTVSRRIPAPGDGDPFARYVE